jgi:hypothetical protein
MSVNHAWMLPGLESTVTSAFKGEGKYTLMGRVRSGLQDSHGGRTHDKGWNYFLGQ